jgi:hypothetical protein
MHHVFLSHSSLDHDITREFYDDLLKLGFRVWFDEVAMEPGDSLIEKIGDAIRSSINLAVLLSANSIQSRWVQEEVSVALTAKLAGAMVKVVPIRLDNTELPPFLSHIRYVDWREEDKKRLEFARLVKMLLSSPGQGGTLLRLVSQNAHAAATDQHSQRFDPAHVLTFSSETDEGTPRTYWLTANESPDTISLKLPRAYPIRLLRILNTQNERHRDRAARLASVQFSAGVAPKTNVWKGAVPPYPTWLNLWFDSVYADAVHVNIEEWAGLGGGLNCIEVYAEE